MEKWIKSENKAKKIAKEALKSERISNNLHEKKKYL